MDRKDSVLCSSNCLEIAEPSMYSNTYRELLDYRIVVISTNSEVTGRTRHQFPGPQDLEALHCDQSLLKGAVRVAMSSVKDVVRRVGGSGFQGVVRRRYRIGRPRYTSDGA